jgi:hypothetical protein
MKKSLPFKPHLFPAVLGVSDLDDHLGYVTFSEFNEANSPFKKPSDMLFEMLILPDPFKGETE